MKTRLDQIHIPVHIPFLNKLVLVTCNCVAFLMSLTYNCLFLIQSNIQLFEQNHWLYFYELEYRQLLIIHFS